MPLVEGINKPFFLDLKDEFVFIEAESLWVSSNDECEWQKWVRDRSRSRNKNFASLSLKPKKKTNYLKYYKLRCDSKSSYLPYQPRSLPYKLNFIWIIWHDLNIVHKRLIFLVFLVEISFLLGDYLKETPLIKYLGIIWLIHMLTFLKTNEQIRMTNRCKEN